MTYLPGTKITDQVIGFLGADAQINGQTTVVPLCYRSNPGQGTVLDTTNSPLKPEAKPFLYDSFNGGGEGFEQPNGITTYAKYEFEIHPVVLHLTTSNSAFTGNVIAWMVARKSVKDDKRDTAISFYDISKNCVGTTVLQTGLDDQNSAWGTVFRVAFSLNQVTLDYYTGTSMTKASVTYGAYQVKLYQYYPFYVEI